MKKIFSVLFLMLIGCLNAFAATYTLPAGVGSNPFGCGGSGPVYTCNNNITLNEDSIIVLTSDVTLNITGDFRAGEDFTVQANGFTLNINVTDDVRISSNANFTGNISAGDDIRIGEDSTVTGNLTAADNLRLDQDTVVNGVCSPTHSQCTGVSPTPTVGCETFLDNFNSVSYSNQNGSVNWVGNWIETGDDNSVSSGGIMISNGELQLIGSGSGGGRLAFGGEPSIEREADLSAYDSATLTFDYSESGSWEGNDDIEIWVSSDGGANWILLHTFTNDQAANTHTEDLTGYIAADTRIAFVEKANSGNEIFYFDNVQIEACGAAVTPAPVMDFHFDESEWTGVANEVLDNSTNSYHASISSGSGLNTITAGAVCRAGQFDGSNDYIVSNDIFSLLRTTASMSFWIKTTQTGNDVNYRAPGVAGIEQSGGGDDIFWGWLDASGRIGISKWDTPAAKSTVAINDGVYHHVVLTRDSPTGAYKIYIDGVLNTSGTTGSGDVGTSFSSIGRIENTNGSAIYLQGDLDELMVFDSVLSDAQVADIYTNQNNGNNYDGSPRGCLNSPWAEWRLDELAWSGVAGEVVDNSGNGLNGTTLGAVNSIPAQICNGIDISANTSSAVQSGFDSNIDIDGDIGNSGSINLWYKSNTNWIGGGEKTLFDASADYVSAAEQYFTLIINNNGELSFNVEDVTDGDFQFGTGQQSFLADEWVHISVTWDMYGSREIYINGNLVTIDTRIPNQPIGQLRTLYFGDNRSPNVPGVGSPNSANGVIDEVIIYNRVLTSSAISTIYSNQLAGNNYDGTARTCAVTGPDHYEISHSGTGITCAPEVVTVTAHYPDHSVFTVATDTPITVTSSPAVDAITSSPVTILSGQSSATFAITETTVTTTPHVNINVSDGAASETSGSATAADDPALAFVDSLFQFVRDTNIPPATNINTQIGGKPSSTGPNAQNLYLRAVRTDDTTGSPVCVAALDAGTHNIDMGYQCLDPNNCNTDELTVSNNLTYDSGAATAIAHNDGATTGNSSAVVLDFDSSGYAPLSFVYNNVGEITLFAGDYTTLSGGTIGIGLSEQFIVRPFGLSLDFDNGSGSYNMRQQDWSDGVLDGSAGDVSYSDPSTNPQNSTVFQTAGSDFPAEITAVLWQAGDDSDNNGEPDVGANLYDNASATLFGQQSSTVMQIVHTLQEPAGAAAGTLATSFTNPYVNGATTGTMNWNEVGIIDIQLSLTSFLGDTSFTSSYTVQDVGRFRPAGFRIQTGSAVDGILDNSCGAFNYIGQDFGYLVNPAFVVEAINTASAVTTNYRGDWNKLTASSFPISVVASDGSNALDIVHTQAGINYNPAGNGVFNVAFGNDTFCYGLDVSGSCVKQPNAQITGFIADITMTLATISDGEVSTAIGQDFSPTSGQLRYGRLAMDNVFGSELVGLTMPMHTQYYDGNNFVLNVDDGCTTVDHNIAGELTVTPVLSGGTSTVTVSSTTAIAGVLDISLTAPGADNIGYIDVVPDLTVSGETWLQYDWDSTLPGLENPSGRANFGIYNGDSRQIYIRQIY